MISGSSVSLNRLSTSLEIIGKSSMLVILMGLPATVYTYTVEYNVPIALLSYRRIIEAGIAPAAVFALLFVWLVQIEKASSTDDETVLEMIADCLPFRWAAPSSWPVLPLVLVANFIVLFVIFCFIVAAALTVDTISGQVFSNASAVGDSTGVIGLIAAVISVLLFCCFTLKRRRKSKPRDLTEQKSLKAVSLIAIVIYILLPVTGWLLGLAADSAPPILGTEILKGNYGHHVYSAPIFLGAICAHFICENMFYRFTRSGDKKTAALAGAGRRISYGVFVAACIIYYSFAVYPEMPRYLGGGQPEKVTVSADPQAFPMRDSDSGANVITETVIRDADLIDATNDTVILCKGGRCLAFKRASVFQISWSADPTNH